MPAPLPLPVDDILDDVVAAVRAHGRVVVEAPPGAGKTTRVPPALANAADGRVVMLEPRRVAARAAAERIATERGERLGDTVGLTTGDERRVGRNCRIEVVTEGVLVRRLQADPSLPGVGAVVLDEFHERSLDADLALAFTLEARAALRDDLTVVVMSATLDGARVAALLDDAPVVRSDGRMHPVEVVHVDRDPVTDLAPSVARAVEDALATHDGDILVFLPGAGDIRRVARLLAVPDHVDVLPLYGSLPPKEQDAALRPPPAGRRVVVLATDLAESSVTVPGVRVVVDAGLSRQPQRDPRTGMTRLVTVRASRASADQRAGRAGRVAPGTAIRLWSTADHARRDPHPTAEIAQADLAGFVLQVAAWGTTPDALPLLDQPPEAAIQGARELLTSLGVLDARGSVTAHGRDVAALPTHPRLGHMLLRARDLGHGGTGARLAALLGERDVLRVSRDHPDTDLATRVAVAAGVPAPPGADLRRGALARVRRRTARLARAVDVGLDTPSDLEIVGLLAALAYPDRIAAPRDTRGRFVLANGRGVQVNALDPLADAAVLVAADVDDTGTDGHVWAGAATNLADLRDHAPGLLTIDDHVGWDPQRGDVTARRRTRVGAAVLVEEPLPDPDPAAIQTALLDGVRQVGLGILPWNDTSRSLRDRAAHLARRGTPTWPSMDDDALLEDLDDWLAPFLGTARRAADLARIPLANALKQRIGWDNARALDDLAPTHVTVPSGRSVPLTYGEDGPVLAVKLQEMFGATQAPLVAGEPVVVHLLSPAGRPLQVTTDLAGFWQTGYPQVRAEMRGRYPKHPWPEDPTTAVPTARTRHANRHRD